MKILRHSLHLYPGVAVSLDPEGPFEPFSCPSRWTIREGGRYREIGSRGFSAAPYSGAVYGYDDGIGVDDVRYEPFLSYTCPICLDGSLDLFWLDQTMTHGFISSSPALPHTESNLLLRHSVLPVSKYFPAIVHLSSLNSFKHLCDNHQHS